MNIKTLLFASYVLTQSFVFLSGMQVEIEKPKTQFLYLTFNTANEKTEASVIVSGISLLLQKYPECKKNYNQLCDLHGTPQENSLKDKIYRIIEHLIDEFGENIAVKSTKCGQHVDFFSTNSQSQITSYIAFEFHTPVETALVEKTFNNVFNQKMLLYNEFTPIDKDCFGKLIPKEVTNNEIYSFNLSGNGGINKENAFCLINCNIL